MHLSAIMHGYVTGTAPSDHMSKFFNITQFYEIQDEDITIHKIQITHEETIRFHFSVKTSQSSNQVIRITGLKHWSNLQASPIIKEYVGTNYAVYNLTNQCMKGIVPPPPPTHKDSYMKNARNQVILIHNSPPGTMRH